MTKINTVECSYLIDTCYEMCSFLGIVLEPELTQVDTTASLVQEALSEASKKKVKTEITNAELFEGDIF